MSITGYFDSVIVINIWNTTDKRTSTMIRDMKAVLRQFDVSMSFAEIDKDRIEDLTNTFDKIRKEVYK